MSTIIELISNQRAQTFHLGLTMAGAVSAGAYTGGVIDYLFQKLDSWQKRKDINNAIWQALETEGQLTEELLIERGYDFRIPMHNVVIEAIGGASAGGMTSTMGLMAAVDPNYAPVETLAQADDPEHTQHNIFYECWVRLLETEKEKAMDLMLQQTDLAGKGIFSLLNVDIIDKLALKAFKNIERLESANLKPYISPKVELLLTLTSLRGVQVSVDFMASEALQSAALDSDLKHNMYVHTMVAHFAIDHHTLDVTTQARYLNMRSDLLRDCSIATGAFPFGLKARRIKGINYEYVKASLERSLRYKTSVGHSQFKGDFEFIAVDGGTMNNEPFSEVYEVLEKRAEDTCNRAQGNICHGIIMIDPFPNYADIENYKFKDSVPDLPGELYGSLRQEAMVKDSSVFTKKYARWMIVPFKWKEADVAYQYPICCASLGAFGGFFDEEFRKHDFFLGRDNCRNFLRKYFTIKWDGKADNSEPIHKYWTDEMRSKFSTFKNEATYLHIIPDMDCLEEGFNANVIEYTYKPFPTYDLKRLESLRPKLSKRIEKLIGEAQNLVNKKTKDEQDKPTEQQLRDKEEIEKLLLEMYPKSFVSNIMGRIDWSALTPMVFFLLRKIGSGYLSKLAIKTIVKDFYMQGLLGNADSRVVHIKR